MQRSCEKVRVYLTVLAVDISDLDVDTVAGACEVALALRFATAAGEARVVCHGHDEHQLCYQALVGVENLVGRAVRWCGMSFRV